MKLIFSTHRSQLLPCTQTAGFRKIEVSTAFETEIPTSKSTISRHTQFLVHIHIQILYISHIHTYTYMYAPDAIIIR